MSSTLDGESDSDEYESSLASELMKERVDGIKTLPGQQEKAAGRNLKDTAKLPRELRKARFKLGAQSVPVFMRPIKGKDGKQVFRGTVAPRYCVIPQACSMVYRNFAVVLPFFPKRISTSSLWLYIWQKDLIFYQFYTNSKLQTNPLPY